MTRYNSSSDDSFVSTEQELSRAIHVRRVREAAGDFYSPEESEFLEEDEYEVQSQRNPPSSWLEEEKDEGASFRQSEDTESATVILYYEKDEIDVREVQEKSVERRRFRLTPAAVAGRPRAASAPPAALTSFQEFKGSQEFLKLEETAKSINELIYKDDGKMDLDSAEGSGAARRLLSSIEFLMNSFAIPCNDRSYRDQFSQAYKVLYKRQSLCYLTEILNSVQESYSYVVVNSEKYIFSSNVLRVGEKLFGCFETLKELVKDIYNL